MRIKTFYNQRLGEIKKFSFLGGDLYHLSRPCPTRSEDAPNEDSSAFVEISPDSGLLVVADGMGGMEKGDKVSKMAIELLVIELKRYKRKLTRNQRMSQIILDALEAVQAEVRKLKISGGTTLSICHIYKGSLRFYNIGDSFCLLSGARGMIKYRSLDDSVTGHGVEAGLMSEEKALGHEDSNIVTNSLGPDEFRVEVSCRLYPSKSDLILLSTDGMSANLTTDQIIEQISTGPGAERLQKVSDLVFQRMNKSELKSSNPDDYTAFLFHFPQDLTSETDLQNTES